MSVRTSCRTRGARFRLSRTMHVTGSYVTGSRILSLRNASMCAQAPAWICWYLCARTRSLAFNPHERARTRKRSAPHAPALLGAHPCAGVCARTLPVGTLSLFGPPRLRLRQSKQQHLHCPRHGARSDSESLGRAADSESAEPRRQPEADLPLLPVCRTQAPPSPKTRGCAGEPAARSTGRDSARRLSKFRVREPRRPRARRALVGPSRTRTRRRRLAFGLLTSTCGLGCGCKAMLQLGVGHGEPVSSSCISSSDGGQ